MQKQQMEACPQIYYTSFLSYLDQYESYNKTLKKNTLLGTLLIEGQKIDFQLKHYGPDIEVNLQTELIFEEEIDEIKRSVADDILAYIANYLNSQDGNHLKLVQNYENRYLITYRQLGNDEELISSQCEKKLINHSKKILELLKHVLKYGDGQINLLASQLLLNI